MRSISRLVSSLATGIGGVGCSLVGVRSGYETPRYEIVETVDEHIEIRRYEPRLAFQTTVSTADHGDARGAAFRVLAAYIFGENQTREKMAMTVPVESRRSAEQIAMTSPVETQTSAAVVRMRFFAPSSYRLDTLPQPVDPRVEPVEIPAETLAVLSFSGSTRAREVAERHHELRTALAATRWRAVGEPVAFFYDPPWTLPFLRRNEVAISVAE